MFSSRSFTNLIGIFTVALTITGSALLVATAADAQPAGSGPMDSARRDKMMDVHIERMAKALDVTPEQKIKLQAITKAAQADIKPLHDQVRARMERALNESKEVLTPEQRTKWDAYMQSHRGRMAERMGTNEKK